MGSHAPFTEREQQERFYGRLLNVASPKTACYTEKNQFAVCIRSAHEPQYYAVRLPQYIASDLVGEGRSYDGVYDLPTHFPYCVEIQDLKPCTSINPTSKYMFQIEMKIGNKEVEINNNQSIMYNKFTTVHGFKTGEKSSFLYVCPSLNSANEYNTGDGSNEIEIKVKRFLCCERQYYVDNDDGQMGAMYRSLGYQSGLRPTDGVTVRGDNFVKHVPTKTLDANWVEETPSTYFKIVLVNSQTEQQKDFAKNKYDEHQKEKGALNEINTKRKMLKEQLAYLEQEEMQLKKKYQM